MCDCVIGQHWLSRILKATGVALGTNLLKLCVIKTGNSA